MDPVLGGDKTCPELSRNFWWISPTEKTPPFDLIKKGKKPDKIGSDVVELSTTPPKKVMKPQMKGRFPKRKNGGFLFGQISIYAMLDDSGFCFFKKMFCWEKNPQRSFLKNFTAKLRENQTRQYKPKKTLIEKKSHSFFMIIPTTSRRKFDVYKKKGEIKKGARNQRC